MPGRCSTLSPLYALPRLTPTLTLTLTLTQVQHAVASVRSTSALAASAGVHTPSPQLQLSRSFENFDCFARTSWGASAAAQTVSMHAYTRACTCMHMRMHMHACVGAHACVRTSREHAHVHAHACMRGCVLRVGYLGDERCGTDGEALGADVLVDACARACICMPHMHTGERGRVRWGWGFCSSRWVHPWRRDRPEISRGRCGRHRCA